jgi:hypothetical protein
MTIEAGGTIISGIAAHSITLLAFSIDSLIELASAGVLIWRLTVELRHGQSFAESAERAASRIGGALLFALAAYIVAAVGWSFWTQQGHAFSWLGLLISVAAMPVMWVLSRRKLHIAQRLVAAHCGPMPWKASPAAGYRSSWWSASLLRPSWGHGGLTRSRRWRLSGFWSRKGAKRGRARNAGAADIIENRRSQRS